MAGPGIYVKHRYDGDTHPDQIRSESGIILYQRMQYCRAVRIDNSFRLSVGADVARHRTISFSSDRDTEITGRRLQEPCSLVSGVTGLLSAGCANSRDDEEV